MDEKGIDRDAVKANLEKDTQKTISPVNMVPYVIMGVKALNTTL